MNSTRSEDKRPNNVRRPRTFGQGTSDTARKALLGIMAAGAAMAGGASAAADLKLYYTERPPYYATTGNEVRGLLADIAEATLKKAGVPFVWTVMPPARQFELVKRGTEAGCVVGAYKNPERSAYARFSREMYRNRPTIALGRKNDRRLARIAGIDALLSAPDLVLLVKKSYSYGTFLDGKIALLAPRMYETTVDSDTMFKQIGGERSDYMFMAAEEGEHAIQTPEGAGLATYPVPGMPEGNPRYLMCSRAVPESALARIDAALP
jgi:polar amino acid transport system substrate-binding protein